MTTPECTTIGSGAGGIKFRLVILLLELGDSKDFWPCQKTKRGQFRQITLWSKLYEEFEIGKYLDVFVRRWLEQHIWRVWFVIRINSHIIQKPQNEGSVWKLLRECFRQTGMNIFIVIEKQSSWLQNRKYTKTTSLSTFSKFVPSTPNLWIG